MTAVSDALARLVRELPPDQLDLLVGLLTTQVRDAPHPPLLLTVIEETDEMEQQVVTTCPHCLFGTTSDENRIHIEDRSIRWTTPSEFDPTAKEVLVYYDETADYEGYVYRCARCQRPVSLPEGWTERTL